MNGVKGFGIHREHHPGWRDRDRPNNFGFEEYSLWYLTERNRRYANPVFEQNGKRKALVDAYGPDVFTNYALDFIERKKDQPFFLYYPMVLPHSPFVPTPDSEEWKDKETVFVHYNNMRNVDSKTIRFVRTKEYKFYQEGRFYHVPTDKREQNSISQGRNVSWEVIKIRKKLREILDQAPNPPHKWKEKH